MDPACGYEEVPGVHAEIVEGAPAPIAQPMIEDDLLSHACRELRKQFRIEHATLQIESGRAAYPCSLASADVI